MADKKWTEVGASFNQVHTWVEDLPLEGVLVNIKKDVGANKSMLYTLEKADHTLVDFWGSTVLDARMANISTGDEIRVTFKGVEKSTKGNKPVKIFKVEKASA